MEISLSPLNLSVQKVSAKSSEPKVIVPSKSMKLRWKSSCPYLAGLGPLSNDSNFSFK